MSEKERHGAKFSDTQAFIWTLLVSYKHKTVCLDCDDRVQCTQKPTPNCIIWVHSEVKVTGRKIYNKISNLLKWTEMNREQRVGKVHIKMCVCVSIWKEITNSTNTVWKCAASQPGLSSRSGRNRIMAIWVLALIHDKMYHSVRKCVSFRSLVLQTRFTVSIECYINGGHVYNRESRYSSETKNTTHSSVV